MKCTLKRGMCKKRTDVHFLHHEKELLVQEIYKKNTGSPIIFDNPVTDSHSSITTLVPTFTCFLRSLRLSFSSLIHPSEASVPIEAGSWVP